LRLRKKPWIDKAILDFSDFVYTEGAEIGETEKGKWCDLFGR